MQKYINRVPDEVWKVQKKRVQALSDKWLHAIGLGYWRIKIEYANTIFDTDDHPDWINLFTVSVDWTRMQANIRCSLSSVQYLDDEELELSFVHELMHIFVKELAACADISTEDKLDDAVAHEERVVQSLAQAMIWAVKYVKHGSKPTKK